MICKKCGALVEAVDLDRHADFYYCECGWQFCDEQGWANRQAHRADDIRKAQKEGI